MKDLTLAEAMQILQAVEQEHPNPEKLEIIAEAYKRGYAAAAKEMKERE